MSMALKPPSCWGREAHSSKAHAGCLGLGMEVKGGKRPVGAKGREAVTKLL